MIVSELRHPSAACTRTPSPLWEYELLGVVRHSETLEPMVLYRALYGEREFWVRPHVMFFETIEHGGIRQPRFTAVA
jgi:hypothetical protein